MRRGLAACCTGLSAALIAVGIGAASNPLGEARDLFRGKQYDRARGLLAAAIEGLRGEERDEGLLLLASLETDAGRATALYERIVSTGKDRAALEAALELARIYYARGEYRSALEALPPSGRRPVQGVPAVSYLRGLCFRQLKDNAHARAEFAGVDRGPYLLWSTLGLAEIDTEEGNIAKAVERYETIGGKYANPIASFKLGECCEILGQRDKSLEAYGALVATFPRSFEASQARAKILRLSRSKEEPTAAKPPKGGEAGTTIGGRGESEPPRDQAYTIQFGAFSERENAIRMARQIETLITDVHVEAVPSGNRTLQRVRAGSYASRGAAESAAALVRQRLGFAGTIVPLR